MPLPSLGYILKSPFSSFGQLYSVLEGQEQLKEQLDVMFKKQTLNQMPCQNLDPIIFIHTFLYNIVSWFIESFISFFFIKILLIVKFKSLNVIIM